MANLPADLVVELRQMAATGYAGSAIWAEAADEIERLRAICMATPQGHAMLSSAFLKDGQLYIDTTCPALDVNGDT